MKEQHLKKNKERKKRKNNERVESYKGRKKVIGKKEMAYIKRIKMKILDTKLRGGTKL